MPLLIDLSPPEAIDEHIELKVRECFAEFGAVHLDRAERSMQVHVPNQTLHRSIMSDGVLETWQRLRRDYDALAAALEGEKALRLRLIRAADLAVEDDRWLSVAAPGPETG